MDRPRKNGRTTADQDPAQPTTAPNAAASNSPHTSTGWGELRLPAGIAGIIAVIATAINYVLRVSTYKDRLTYSPNNMYVETARQQALSDAFFTLTGWYVVAFVVVLVVKVVRHARKQTP
jgi:hypothetical protein